MQPDNKNSNNEEETGSQGESLGSEKRDSEKRDTLGFVPNVELPEVVLQTLGRLELDPEKVLPEELGLLFMLRAFRALNVDVEVIHSTSTDVNQSGLQVSEVYLFKITPANEKDNPLVASINRASFRRNMEEVYAKYENQLSGKQLISVHPNYSKKLVKEQALNAVKAAVGEAAKQLVIGIMKLLYGRLKIRNFSELGCRVVTTDLRSVVISLIETGKREAKRKATTVGVLSRVPLSGEVSSAVRYSLVRGTDNATNELVLFAIWRTAVIGIAVRIEEYYAKHVKEPTEDDIANWFEQFTGITSIQSPKCATVRRVIKDLYKDDPDNAPSSFVRVEDTLYASLVTPVSDVNKPLKVEIDALPDRPELVNFAVANKKEAAYQSTLERMNNSLRERSLNVEEEALVGMAKGFIGPSPLDCASKLNNLAVIPSLLAMTVNAHPCIIQQETPPQNFEELIDSFTKVETPEQVYERIKALEQDTYKGISLRFRRLEELVDYNNGVEGNAKAIEAQEGGKHLLNSEKAFIRGALVSRYFRYDESEGAEVFSSVATQGEVPTYYVFESDNKVTGYGLREGAFCAMYYGNRLSSWLEHEEELLALRCRSYGIPRWEVFKASFSKRMIYLSDGLYRLAVLPDSGKELNTPDAK